MTYNLPLLRKTRDWMTEQMDLPYASRQLNMEWWHLDDARILGKDCGTTYCVAGHLAETLLYNWDGRSSIYDNGKWDSIQNWAADQLGIDYEEARDLFFVSEERALSQINRLIRKAEEEERDAAA